MLAISNKNYKKQNPNFFACVQLRVLIFEVLTQRNWKQHRVIQHYKAVPHNSENKALVPTHPKIWYSGRRQNLKNFTHKSYFPQVAKSLHASSFSSASIFLDCCSIRNTRQRWPGTGLSAQTDTRPPHRPEPTAPAEVWTGPIPATPEVTLSLSAALLYCAGRHQADSFIADRTTMYLRLVVNIIYLM